MNKKELGFEMIQEVSKCWITKKLLSLANVSSKVPSFFIINAEEGMGMSNIMKTLAYKYYNVGVSKPELSLTPRQNPSDFSEG